MLSSEYEWASGKSLRGARSSGLSMTPSSNNNTTTFGKESIRVCFSTCMSQHDQEEILQDSSS